MCYHDKSLKMMALKSLLRDEKRTVAALQSLPRELFPLANSLGSCKLLHAVLQNRPFSRLPLGSPNSSYHQFWTRQTVLDGLDELLSLKDRPRNCRLRVLDLHNIEGKFWRAWCEERFPTNRDVPPLVDEGRSREKPSAPLTVCIDVRIFEGQLDTVSNFLINWARKRRRVHLCCKRLEYDVSSKHLTLFRIQRSCVQEVAVTHSSIFITHPRPFASWLSGMTNLKRLYLDHGTQDGRIMGPHNRPLDTTEKERLFGELIGSLRGLSHLRELQVPAVTPGRPGLNRLHRYEPELIRLLQWPNIAQLRKLCLRGIPLASIGGSLEALLQTCAGTLQVLDLGTCGLLDAHLEALLLTLNLCSWLQILNLLGNRLSRATLKQLLLLMAGGSLTCELYSAPLECFSPEGSLL
ncbi:PRAME family member 12 [Galemys pyrenaicus]|uniref:PRAME family member 12 n=1 Tax=Galemys pyrenaicus TaxID=202257 RepID=A0A8J5ZG42_GALPY|nr:PRAME family member 12 [Galemys pyrenaicus]